MARPRPEPCALVVKKALKILSASSGGTPGPVVGHFDHDGRDRVQAVGRAARLLRVRVTSRAISMTEPVPFSAS